MAGATGYHEVFSTQRPCRHVVIEPHQRPAVDAMTVTAVASSLTGVGVAVTRRADGQRRTLPDEMAAAAGLGGAVTLERPAGRRMVEGRLGSSCRE